MKHEKGQHTMLELVLSSNFKVHINLENIKNHIKLLENLDDTKHMITFSENALSEYINACTLKTVTNHGVETAIYDEVMRKEANEVELGLEGAIAIIGLEETTLIQKERGNLQLLLARNLKGEKLEKIGLRVLEVILDDK
ncbi:hypothetical protein CR513_22732, partial [Mucuna pruriens]